MAQKLRYVFQKMATIAVVRSGESYRITLRGCLSSGDLKRLERACRYALEHKLVPLELNLERVSSIDHAARAYLERLRARGARLRGLLDPPRAGLHRGVPTK
jgi:hypothetical protein